MYFQWKKSVFTVAALSIAASMNAQTSTSVQSLIDTVCFDAYRDFISYLNSNPSASGTALGTELDTIRQTYNGVINQQLGVLGWPSDGQQAYVSLNAYADQIQGVISYYTPTYPQGNTPLANVPLPTGADASLATLLQEICALYQQDANQLATLQQSWATVQKTYSGTTSVTAAEKSAYSTIESEVTALPTTLQTIFGITTTALATSVQATLTQLYGEISTQSTAFATSITQASSAISSLSTQLQPAVSPTGLSIYPLLKTKGVTYEVVNGLYIPYGGMNDGFSASEAWGYSLRNAVANNDPTFAGELWNSFYHFSLASVAWEQTNQVYDQRWPTVPFGSYKFGMMGWHVNQTTGAYATEGDEVSATDADSDILHSLLDFVASDPNLTIIDPVSGQTMTLVTLVNQAVTDFAHCDCILKDSTCGISLDCWGDQSPHPDYYDPTLLQKASTYAKANNLKLPDGTAVADVINQAIVNEMARINSQIATYKTIGDQYGSTTMSAEGLRFLMRFGQFISWSKADHSSSLFKSAVAALSSTVEYLFANNAVNVDHSFAPDYISMDINGMAQGQASGPMLLALMALQANNALPSNVTSAIISDVERAFVNDQQYQFANISSWTYNDYQENGNYFGLELLNLAAAIMKENGIYPSNL